MPVLWIMLSNSPDPVVREMHFPPTPNLAHGSFLGPSILPFLFLVVSHVSITLSP